MSQPANNNRRGGSGRGRGAGRAGGGAQGQARGAGTARAGGSRSSAGPPRGPNGRSAGGSAAGRAASPGVGRGAGGTATGRAGGTRSASGPSRTARSDGAPSRTARSDSGIGDRRGNDGRPGGGYGAARSSSAPAARRPSGGRWPGGVEQSGGRERGGGGARGVGGEQVEGRRAVRELLVAGRRRVREVLMAAEMDDAPILDDIRELCAARRVTLREIGRGKFETLVATQSSQGVLARAQSLEEADLDALVQGQRGRAGRQPFLLALDGVTDPGNFGALLRSAEGAGVSGVILPRHRSVHVTPAVTKAAAGAVEYMPIALVGGLPTTLSNLARQGVWTIGLDGSADRSLYDLPYLGEPICVVLGAEGRGLSRLVRERCNELAAIPLQGELNSLNVAAAAAVACFEVARCRQQPSAASLAGDGGPGARAEDHRFGATDLADEDGDLFSDDSELPVDVDDDWT